MTVEQPNLLKILSAARFAEGLPNKHLQCLCRAARLLRVPANQKLFQEGSVEDEIFVISSGHVRLSMNVPGRGDLGYELMKRIAHVLSQRLLSTRLQLLDLFSHAGTAS